jgi:hypothetical protein
LPPDEPSSTPKPLEEVPHHPNDPESADHPCASCKQLHQRCSRELPTCLLCSTKAIRCDYSTDPVTTPPTTTSGTSGRGNDKDRAREWTTAIEWHRRYCNSSGVDRSQGCHPGCPLRKSFPKTWETWNTKRFSVVRDGRQGLVNGFFVDHYRLKPARCTVLGEVVDGGRRLDRNTKHVYRVDSDFVDSPTMSPEHAIASPCVEHVERRQRQTAVRRHANRVEPNPIAKRTHWVASTTTTQSADEFWRAASKWANENIPTPQDDTTDWFWMLNYASLPYDGVPFPEVGKLETTPTIGDVQAESVAPPAYNLVSSCRINPMPEGFQMVEGMTHAEAYLQGFLAGQNQKYGS